MDEDGLLIVGAKKKNEVKNYDKNNLNDCIESFKKFVLQSTEENNNKDKFIELCQTGEVDKHLIRPTIWKMLLDVLSIDSKIDDWVVKLSKQRALFKTKLKGLNTLKKFSGDPLGGSNEVNLIT
jgi:hypothetical protein